MKKEIKKFFDFETLGWNMPYQNFWEALKAILRGEFSHEIPTPEN